MPEPPLDVIVIGRSNMDLWLPVPTLPAPGQTVFSQGLFATPGGKAFNQAIAVTRDGGRAALVSRTGDDSWGQRISDELAAASVVTTGFRLLPTVQTGAAVVEVTPDGENSIIVAVSPDTELTAEDVHHALTALHAPVTVIQLDLPPQPVEALLAARRDTLLIANLIPDPRLTTAILAKIDLYVVNEHEAAAVLGTHPANPAAAAERLRELGPERVVVTGGAYGAAYADEDGTTRVPATAVTPVDTTGAGDAFLGTLALRLARGHDLLHAVVAAVAAGTAAVQHAAASPRWRR